MLVRSRTNGSAVVAGSKTVSCCAATAASRCRAELAAGFIACADVAAGRTGWVCAAGASHGAGMITGSAFIASFVSDDSCRACCGAATALVLSTPIDVVTAVPELSDAALPAAACGEEAERSGAAPPCPGADRRLSVSGAGWISSAGTPSRSRRVLFVKAAAKICAVQR